MSKHKKCNWNEYCNKVCEKADIFEIDRSESEIFEAIYMDKDGYLMYDDEYLTYNTDEHESAEKYVEYIDSVLKIQTFFIQLIHNDGTIKYYKIIPSTDKLIKLLEKLDRSDLILKLI